MKTVAGWKHWDVVALISGGVPLIVFLSSIYELRIFDSFAGPLVLGSVLLYLVSAALAWRSGDGRMIAGGCGMLLVPAVLSFPLILLAVACFAGNCL